MNEYEKDREAFKQMVIDQLNVRIKECESSAEEYIQEIGDEEMMNTKLTEAATLRDVIKFVEGL